LFDSFFFFFFFSSKRGEIKTRGGRDKEKIREEKVDSQEENREKLKEHE